MLSMTGAARYMLGKLRCEMGTNARQQVKDFVKAVKDWANHASCYPRPTF